MKLEISCLERAGLMPTIIQMRDFKGICIKHSEWENKYKDKCPSCLDEEKLERDRLRLKKQNENKITEILNRSCFPLRNADNTLENFFPKNAEQTKILEVCNRYVKNIEGSIKLGKGLLFLGNPALGKTHLAVGIVKALAQQLYSALYIKQYLLVKECQENKSFFAQACKLGILVIDEVGIGDTDFTKDITYQIIDQRYDAMKPTILISNLSNKDFVARCSSALQSRLAEVSLKLVFTGEDQRLKKNLQRTN